MLRQLLFILTILPGSAVAEDRFWILWEKFRYVGENCPHGTDCILKRDFASRPLRPDYSADLYRMFGVMDPRGQSAPRQDSHPEAPEICAADQDQIAVGFDPLQIPQSLKIEALRGIKTIHMDLRNLSAPPHYSDSFGQDIHTEFSRRLTAAGIRVVDKEVITTVPGQPSLSIFFSMRDAVGDCDYEFSVFASLSQEVLLARDIRIKVTAGVWAHSTGSNDSLHMGDERDAILRVADAFILDHRTVNPK